MDNFLLDAVVVGKNPLPSDLEAPQHNTNNSLATTQATSVARQKKRSGPKRRHVIRRLPRNAGTAFLIGRQQLQQQREEIFEPPEPVIEPVVIVC